MGVGGAAGVLDKQGHKFGSWISVRDTKLVLDVTDALFWLVKRHMPEGATRPDLYGSNMVALCAFYRDFFKRLRERNVTPVVVFAGGRLFEQTHGRLAAKTMHLEQSARLALRRIQNRHFRDSYSLPQLAHNALREVINEFNFEHLHQATYEVYPLLERLAGEHQCPVLTSHSDFMFADARHGFIWTDKLELPAVGSPGAALRALLYRRDELLGYFSSLAPGAGALRSLYVLLRDDFAGTHYEAVNRVLNLPPGLSLAPGARDRQKTRRLLHVLNNWPPQLTSLEQVRLALASNPRRSVALERDFRSIHESFSVQLGLFEPPNRLLVQSFLPRGLAHDQLAGACLRRESTVQYVMELKQRSCINRCQTVEDLRVLRSTWSLGDRARQLLVGRLQLDQLQLFDRRLGQADYRSIRPLQEPVNQNEAASLSRDNLFWLFHFSESALEQVSSLAQRQYQISADQARCLALLLLLARFAHKLAFRETYDNSNAPAALPTRYQAGGRLEASQSSSLPSNASSEAEPDGNGGNNNITPNENAALAALYLNQQARGTFYAALVNSFVFYWNDQEVGDSQRGDVPAEIRVARARMGPLERMSNLQGLGDTEYFQHKHRIEALNSALHHYKELNSLFDFPGPQLVVSRCYNGTLLYQLLRRWSNNLAEHLLRVDESLMSLLAG